MSILDTPRGILRCSTHCPLSFLGSFSSLPVSCSPQWYGRNTLRLWSTSPGQCEITRCVIPYGT